MRQNLSVFTLLLFSSAAFTQTDSLADELESFHDFVNYYISTDSNWHRNNDTFFVETPVDTSDYTITKTDTVIKTPAQKKNISIFYPDADPIWGTNLLKSYQDKVRALEKKRLLMSKKQYYLFIRAQQKMKHLLPPNPKH